LIAPVETVDAATMETLPPDPLPAESPPTLLIAPVLIDEAEDKEILPPVPPASLPPLLDWPPDAEIAPVFMAPYDCKVILSPQPALPLRLRLTPQMALNLPAESVDAVEEMAPLPALPPSAKPPVSLPPVVLALPTLTDPEAEITISPP